ncbi:MAG: hypothetical protein KAT29_06645, partial [Anaerolineales bacterium]|nr:hypothetical protein [Anaerolineales bacterium]
IALICVYAFSHGFLPLDLLAIIGRPVTSIISAPAPARTSIGYELFEKEFPDGGKDHPPGNS